MRHNLTNDGNTLVRWSRKTSLQTIAACGLLLGAGMMQSCEKEILTGQPEWLGNSIYERLQEGITVNDGSQKTFNTTLRLIDDLGYKETLSKTGSKTVFATPDEAYDEWFAQKGIKYEQLSLAQKKRLFNNSMINNAYLLELMSNVSGNPPEEGLCMRRETAATIYDSIPSITLAEMPVDPFNDVDKDAWAPLRGSSHKVVPIFKDNTSSPMIHFLPDFMATSRITDDDLYTISNGQSNSINDSWINGKKVISSEQTCKNGYIYVIDGVVDGTQSMADIINNDPRMTIWSSFINRWSCPEPITGNALKEYQTLFNTSDSIYNLRYFNSGASASHALLQLGHMETALPAISTLLFDPGWNQYIYDNAKDLHYDAGVMFVPTDEAVNDWWNNGDGRSLKDRYGTMDNIPYATLAQLLRVNMKESFIDAVPSKFHTVLDDEQKPLGITKDNVVESVMGCNGVVYLVNKVFAPVMYRSVIAPALIQGSGSDPLTVAYNAITGTYPDPKDPTKTKQELSKDFTSYLNSLESDFSVILPYNVSKSTNKSTPTRKVFRYIDPCSYGLPRQNLIEFYYEKEIISGTYCKVTLNENGEYTIDESSVHTTLTPEVISNRLYNLLDNSIILNNIVPGQEYYNTKGGAIIKANEEGGNTVFQGGFQLEYGTSVNVSHDNRYNQANGKTYCCAAVENEDLPVVDIPLTATKSVYQVLKEAAEKEDSQCKLFYQLLKKDPTSNSLLKSSDTGYNCANPDGNFNLTLFDSYNYTVYVPSDQAIQELIDNEYLPTWDDYDNVKNSETDTKKADSICKVIANIIHDFVKYHVQDRAVCIGGEPANGALYESAMLDPETKRFYTYRVTADNSDLTIKDNCGNTRRLVKANGLWNKICREYWIKGTPGAIVATIESCSDAVVHQIDGVLFYDELVQKTSWKLPKSTSTN